jgi:hypothetical protein
MDRSRLNAREHDKTQTRIVWRDGPFRVECTGEGKGMRLRVYYGGHVMADERVPSVQAAWNRGTQVCSEFGAADVAAYETGSG